MAIQLLGELSKLTFSGWKRPDDTGDVLRNVLKFSIWGALGTGCVAGVSASFSRTVIERSAIASYVFKPSLISCGAFTAFAVFLIYRLTRMPSDKRREPLEKTLNAQTVSLERNLGLICSTVAMIAMLSRDYLNLNPMLKSLAERSVDPLMSIAVTSMVIRLFHLFQLSKVGTS